MLQDVIAGFVAAPLWAQIAMVFFGFMVAVSLLEPVFRRRKYARRFADIVRVFGREPPPARGFPVKAPISADGRAFELRHDLQYGGKNSSYRGPRGHLLITATRLAGTKWGMHNVDITRMEGMLARLVRSQRLTGDPAFDERFAVMEDGVPVRDGWLDAPTRQEILRAADGALPGVIWIRDSELIFIIQDPWKGIDGPVIRALLQRQAALAAALDRTAALRS
jgi:hypothetical protein